MKRKQRRAYVLIVRKGKLLLVRNRRGRWTLPGGRAKRDEKLRRAVKREVKEETGLAVRLKDRVSGNHIRRHRRPCAKCVAFEAEIRKGKPKPKREITEVDWVEIDKALKRLRAFRRKQVRAALDRIL
jgi:8-oxo-dGTP diphosphatase